MVSKDRLCTPSPSKSKIVGNRNLRLCLPADGYRQNVEMLREMGGVEKSPVDGIISVLVPRIACVPRSIGLAFDDDQEFRMNGGTDYELRLSDSRACLRRGLQELLDAGVIAALLFYSEMLDLEVPKLSETVPNQH